jgi:lipoprotein-anchoring transpeptidase ErfK/SrfK
VTVGGVNLGGMTTDEALAALRFDIKRPLQKSVRIEAGGRSFELSAKEANVDADLGAMVDGALAESREGNVLTRTVRDLTGGTVDSRVPSQVTYSREAVRDLVGSVESEMERDAQDAEVVPTAGGLDTAPAETGVDVLGGDLTRAINAELESPSGDRKVVARMEKVKPDVTQDELAEEYPHYITVDRGSFQLRYYENLKLADSYSIAVGRTGFDTPSGLYEIQNKAVDPAWSVPEWGGELAGQVIPGGTAENPLKARWLGIYDGAGIHGTDDVGSLGTAASHGCIRMAIPEVIELYDRVPVGAPIYIQ